MGRIENELNSHTLPSLAWATKPHCKIPPPYSHFLYSHHCIQYPAATFTFVTLPPPFHPNSRQHTFLSLIHMYVSFSPPSQVHFIIFSLVVCVCYCSFFLFIFREMIAAHSLWLTEIYWKSQFFVDPSCYLMTLSSDFVVLNKF